MDVYPKKRFRKKKKMSNPSLYFFITPLYFIFKCTEM